ncbi:MAG: methyltransferase domain-containing protein [Patescibacteria group bacterium]
MKKLDFIKTFMRDIKVAAFAPTSRHAIDRMLHYVPKDAQTVVEYGPGDGVITKPLLERLPANAQIIAIERNGDFVRELAHINDPRLSVKQGDALLVAEYLQEAGINKLDVAISGIPFSFLNPTQRERIVAQTHAALSPNGVFIIYQFSPFMLLYLRRWFTDIKLRLAWPLFFIMVATKG